MSAAHEIATMSSSINNTMVSLTGILENTTKHTTQFEAVDADALATKAIEMQEGLSRKQKADAVITIMNNPRMALIYLNMQEEELQWDSFSK